MKEIDPFVNGSVLRYLNLNWLYTRLYENDWFYIDYWSFVHCWSGFLVFLLLLRLNVKYKWAVFVALLVMYECLEIALRYFRINIFSAEVYTDTNTDIIVGVLGGLLALWVYSTKKTSHRNGLKYKEPFLLTIITLSFVFSGFYNYSSNIDALEKGIRVPLIFIHWGVIVFSLLLAYHILTKKISALLSVFVLYLLYFSVYAVVHIFWSGYFEFWKPFFPIFSGLKINGFCSIHYLDMIVPVSVVSGYQAFLIFFKFVYQLNPKKERRVMLKLKSVKS